MGTLKRRKTLGIFGGTFDPVHVGHITIAQELKNYLQLDEMRLVPCRLPPHRNRPSASETNRLQMLHIAVESTSLQVDERELKREGPSYTFDTLQSLRKEYGNDCALFLCMGMDAFAEFHHWHRWLEIPKLAHIIVVTRAYHGSVEESQTLNHDVSKLLKKYQTTDKKGLTNSPAGEIYLTQLSQIPVSSTSIRCALSQDNLTQDDCEISGLNPKVQQFIQQRALYRS